MSRPCAGLDSRRRPPSLPGPAETRVDEQGLCEREADAAKACLQGGLPGCALRVCCRLLAHRICATADSRLTTGLVSRGCRSSRARRPCRSRRVRPHPERPEPLTTLVWCRTMGKSASKPEAPQPLTDLDMLLTTGLVSRGCRSSRARRPRRSRRVRPHCHSRKVLFTLPRLVHATTLWSKPSKMPFLSHRWLMRPFWIGTEFLRNKCDKHMRGHTAQSSPSPALRRLAEQVRSRGSDGSLRKPRLRASWRRLRSAAYAAALGGGHSGSLFDFDLV
jgi:hypothetical protein